MLGNLIILRHGDMIETKTVIAVFIRSKVSCSFETHYHTDLATFGVDKNEIESGIVEGASAPATSFTFDLTLTTDHQLSEDLPEGFTRVIGDMNYFKVNFMSLLVPRHMTLGARSVTCYDRITVTK